MIRRAIEKAVRRSDLTEREAFAAFGEIMSGRATPAQIGGLLAALRAKGESVAEITGAAKAMRARSLRIRPRRQAVDIDRDDITVDRETIVDTCGTGGSGTNTFNISTTVAFVVAGCGLAVAKHGNRSVSSRCGSADVLEALGVRIDCGPARVRRSLETVGIAFLYAPLFHAAMKHAVGPRRELGVRTIFNILGPLCNPAGATCQVLGVYEPRLTEVMARVLRNLGARRAFVVHGMDTLDEMSIAGRTRVSELRGGRIRTYYVTPAAAGLKRAPLGAIRGGDAKRNAALVLSVLCGERGPRRDVVLLNAAAALVAGGRARGLKEGVMMAARSIDEGRAMEKLRQLIRLTNR